MRMETKIAKPNAAPYFTVNTAVWVKNPGPIAEVAIIKIEATMAHWRSDKKEDFSKDILMRSSSI